jgi:hypothetical protein
MLREPAELMATAIWIRLHSGEAGGAHISGTAALSTGLVQHHPVPERV